MKNLKPGEENIIKKTFCNRKKKLRKLKIKYLWM